MNISRRGALKVAALGAVAATGVREAEARERPVPPEDATGMLYDSTLCIGCKACVAACRRANELTLERDSTLYDDSVDLTGHTANIIKLHQGDEGYAFVKQQCMHCVDPACASACMMGSFQKRENGIVTWVPDKCIGCRYCQIACPFDVPKFEWDSPLPRMVKCQMCLDKAGGQEPGQLRDGVDPACCEVCPREAVIYGDYEELKAEAQARLDANPERYNPRVYGLDDLGGTQVLYLAPAGVEFSDLGLPEYGPESVPHTPVGLQHKIYKGFVAPVALYAVLAGLTWRSRRQADAEAGQEVAT
ncbi:MAG: hydrogenase 2 operon protein HybA [marine benthic group bacterium]|jgi:Fe-S-cluster-containing dehydrogenase component|nr:hydrogenase 2 operon protein HybA [Candidatus Benthicola marisminoris]